MTVNMDWRDAMAVRCIERVFFEEERAVGWPCCMEPEQLAAMQRPFQHGDRAGKKSMEALWDALSAAIEAGKLEAATSVVRVQKFDAERTQKNRQWAQERGAMGLATAWRYEEQEIKLVAPQAFATWLAVQGMEPSQHIAAWFKVQSVAGAQAAPAIEAQGVTDWSSLVRYRLQFASWAAQKRPAWLLEHVEILAAQLHEEHQAGRGRGALGRLAGELGSVRSTVGELLKKHGFNQATGEKQQALSTPWSGIGGRGGKAA